MSHFYYFGIVRKGFTVFSKGLKNLDIKKMRMTLDYPPSSIFSRKFNVREKV